MRGMHSKLRTGGLAAVVGTTTLVLPLIAITAAQAAAPKSDLSITKLVRVDGQPTFAESVYAAPGDTVEYQLTVVNKSTATASATQVKVTDVLPSELTYVPNSVSAGNDCSVTGQALACNPGTFSPGVSTTITFKATLDDQISTAGLPKTQGHLVDVQKQETFAELPAGTDQTISATCPAGYLAVDGGLLLDSIDNGAYSDVVVIASQRFGAGTELNPERWQVRASNLGDDRVTGKVTVNCLNATLGGEHSHALVQRSVPGLQQVFADQPAGTKTFTTACATDEIPFAPVYDTTDGTMTVRTSAPATVGGLPAWSWTVDHGDATAAWFGISCLKKTTTDAFGHSATLVPSAAQGTVVVAGDSRAEGNLTCTESGHALVGGYDTASSDVLSLGRMPRGDSYAFRFFNTFSDSVTATTSMLCLDDRTAPEAAYRHVTNTALVSTSTSDKSAADNRSSADLAVQGDPGVPPASGVVIDENGTRVPAASGKIKSVKLKATCNLAKTCSFSIKVTKPGPGKVLATRAFSVGSGRTVWVSVPTTAAGRTLGSGIVDVKVKTSTGVTRQQVNLT